MAEQERPVAQMSFEEAMAELEAVVGKLEAGDVPLDDSIALYERGARLRAHCEARLKAAEEKIAAITLDGNGNPTGTAPLQEAQGSGAAAAGSSKERQAAPAQDDEIPF